MSKNKKRNEELSVYGGQSYFCTALIILEQLNDYKSTPYQVNDFKIFEKHLKVGHMNNELLHPVVYLIKHAIEVWLKRLEYEITGSFSDTHKISTIIKNIEKDINEEELKNLIKKYSEKLVPEVFRYKKEYDKYQTKYLKNLSILKSNSAWMNSDGQNTKNRYPQFNKNIPSFSQYEYNLDQIITDCKKMNELFRNEMIRIHSIKKP